MDPEELIPFITRNLCLEIGNVKGAGLQGNIKSDIDRVILPCILLQPCNKFKCITCGSWGYRNHNHLLWSRSAATLRRDNATPWIPCLQLLKTIKLMIDLKNNLFVCIFKRNARKTFQVSVPLLALLIYIHLKLRVTNQGFLDFYSNQSYIIQLVLCMFKKSFKSHRWKTNLKQF